MPAKPKASARTKRGAIAAAFGDVPVDSENIDFLTAAGIWQRSATAIGAI
jgi:hypothetical protein